MRCRWFRIVLFASRMIFKGYKNPLTYKDIWDIRNEDKSETIYDTFQKHWETELDNKRYYIDII